MPSDFIRAIMASNGMNAYTHIEGSVNMDLVQPFKLCGPEPRMIFPEVCDVVREAWNRQLAARLEEGLVVRIYGGDVYLMVCYRVDEGGEHRFQEANGNGWVFGPEDYKEFLVFLGKQTSVKPPPEPVMRVSSYTGRASTF